MASHRGRDFYACGQLTKGCEVAALRHEPVGLSQGEAPVRVAATLPAHPVSALRMVRTLKVLRAASMPTLARLTIHPESEELTERPASLASREVPWAQMSESGPNIF